MKYEKSGFPFQSGLVQGVKDVEREKGKMRNQNTNVVEEATSAFAKTKTFTNPLTGRTRTISKSGSIWKGNKSKSVSMSGGYKGHKSKQKWGLFNKTKSKPYRCKGNKSC